MSTERLRAAIQKAKKERGATEAAPPAGPATQSPAVSRGGVRRGRADEVAEHWEALELIRPNSRRLVEHHILAFASAQSATPFDIMRTRMLQRMRENNWRRVAITSPRPACGKSTLAMNLAFGIARQPQRRVVSIEADMRRPSHERILGAPKANRAVAALLSGKSSFEETGFRAAENLALATSERSVSNASDILMGDQVGDVLAEIDTRYAPDIAIFDVPPLLIGDDTQVFLHHVDCAVIVAAAGTTTVDEVDRCERMIAEITGVAGIVLNKARYGITREYGY